MPLFGFSSIVAPLAAYLLSTYASTSFQGQAPWMVQEANSDQRQPVYLGVSPREMALFGQFAKASPTLPFEMKRLAEQQALVISKNLISKRVGGITSKDELAFEIWPARNDDGLWTWVFSRWGTLARPQWQWIPVRRSLTAALSAAFSSGSSGSSGDPLPFLPTTYVSSDSKAHSLLFDDLRDYTDLYQKPLFGDCVWTDPTGTQIYSAWNPLEDLPRFSNYSNLTCHNIPQPARYNGKPISWILTRSAAGKWSWPKNIHWETPALPNLSVLNGKPQVRQWDPQFVSQFGANIERFQSEFQRKNSEDPGNQLEAFADVLQSHYDKMGLSTFRQCFTWRTPLDKHFISTIKEIPSQGHIPCNARKDLDQFPGVHQSNVVAILPGTAKDHDQKPVLMADHYDTAYAENYFAKTGIRQSAPGADDNLSATSALLQAASALKNVPHDYDIWLVHLTGEEFPADDLGARYLTQWLLKNKQDVRGIVLMDMISFRKPSDRIFQLNAGDSPESIRMARVALGAHRAVSSSLQPVIRLRFDPKSYLYNTDGIIFSEAGFPVLLFNEHINELENFDRKYYHQTTDTEKTLDLNYGATIAKVAIETAARLANERAN